MYSFDFYSVFYVIGWLVWFDIILEGVIKVFVFDVLCCFKGIDLKDVLVIGDGNNDIEML